MARTIEIDANILFDALELIDERAEVLREQAADARANFSERLSNGYDAIAAEWEEDARTIRRALGVDIDGED